MKARNYAAMGLIVLATFFERWAYYAFRAGALHRLMTEGSSYAVGRSLMTSSLWLGLGASATAGAIAIALRSRFFLLACTILLLVAHAAGFASPGAGLVLTGMTGPAVRVLMLVLIAEEIDDHHRIWKLTAVLAATMFAVNVAAALGPPTNELTLHRPVLRLIPAGLTLVVVACAAVVAFAFRGAPFAWGGGETVVAGDKVEAPYRADPTVVRTSVSPNVAVIVIAMAAAFFMNCQGAITGHISFEFASGRSAFLLSQVTEGFALFAIGIAALIFAMNRSTASATYAMAGGAVFVALGALALFVAQMYTSSALSLLASGLQGLGEGMIVPAALAYVIGTTNSKWSGLLAGGQFFAASVAMQLANVVAPRAAAVLSPANLLALTALGVVLLVFGARWNRSEGAMNIAPVR